MKLEKYMVFFGVKSNPYHTQFLTTTSDEPNVAELVKQLGITQDEVHIFIYKHDSTRKFHCEHIPEEIKVTEVIENVG